MKNTRKNTRRKANTAVANKTVAKTVPRKKTAKPKAKSKAKPKPKSKPKPKTKPKSKAKTQVKKTRVKKAQGKTTRTKATRKKATSRQKPISPLQASVQLSVQSPSQRPRARLLTRPPAAPSELFVRWYRQAQSRELSDPNAMTLATLEPNGSLSARIVLLKDAQGDIYTFYTNTRSRKGQALAHEPRVALLFHWKSLRRQIRLEGKVRSVSEATADAYFATRPRGAQIGAWASQQSRVQADGRRGLEQRTARLEKRFAGKPVPRPPHWSGYGLHATRMEFWNEGQFRLHERVEYRKQRGVWRWQRLDP